MSYQPLDLLLSQGLLRPSTFLGVAAMRNLKLLAKPVTIFTFLGLLGSAFFTFFKDRTLVA